MRTRRASSPSWCAPTRFAPTMPLNNAVGLLHEEMRRCGSLIMAAADAHKLPAGGALAVDRDGFADAVQTRSQAEPLIEIRREEIADLPDAAAGETIIATGPLTSPDLAGVDPRAHRRGCARLLRRDRADRASRHDRLLGRLVPVALRQAGPRRHRRRLHQLPARSRPVRALRRSAARGREARLQGVGDRDALLRGLPADRGDGRARARDACATGR